MSQGEGSLKKSTGMTPDFVGVQDMLESPLFLFDFSDTTSSAD
jgi:hypothetical protein